MSHAKRSGIATAAFLFVLGLGGIGFNRAHAALHTVAAGYGVSVPMGNLYSVLPRSSSYQAEVWVDYPAMGEFLEARLSLGYQPFQVRNVNSSTYKLWDGFLGLVVHAKDGLFGIRPFLGLDVGLMYEVLGFNDVSGSIQNSATRFAIQASPGVDIPIVSRLGVMAQMPVVLMTSTNVVFWNATFSLRWRL